MDRLVSLDGLIRGGFILKLPSKTPGGTENSTALQLYYMLINVDGQSLYLPD